MIKTVREDQDILEGMVNDPALLDKMIRSEEEIVKVSPFLLFTVFINRVRKDLDSLSFTLEYSSHETIPVFDVGSIKRFLEQIEIRHYLIEMLASFVRINSYTIPVRVRKGLWYKYRISDYNIDSLLGYIEVLETEEQFPTLKRIADLCLFLLGVFPETLRSSSVWISEEKSAGRGKSAKSREEITDLGKQFYETASKHKTAYENQLVEVLETIGSHFEIAVKPLSLIADHYLRGFKKNIFP